MRLILEPVWSWPVLVATATAVLLLTFWTYPPRLRPLTKGWRWTLMGLRIASALLLIAAMLRPAIQIAETDRRESELVVLMDDSRSMTVPDAPGGLTRRQAVARLIEESADSWDKLAEEVEIWLVDFSEEMKLVENVSTEAEGNATAIGKVIDELRDETRGDRLMGIVLLSDGAQRVGGTDDVNPLAAARRLAEQRGVPIHSVVFGTSELSSSGLDLAVEDLTLEQPVTFERKTVPVKMQVRLLGAAGRPVRVRLLVEDRTGKALGESGELKEIPLSGDAVPFRDVLTTQNSVVLPVELSFVAEQAGDYKIAAEVVPLEGEARRNNNRLETLITVRKGGLRVAYFDVLRTEQKFIRRLNETAKIQLDTQFVLPGGAGRRSLLNPKFFEPGNYDVYLIGDIPADVFQSQGDELLTKLAARVREGSGLAMLGGVHNFGPGGYGASPLRDVLPVRMSAGDRIAPDQAGVGQITTPVQFLPTRQGQNHYLMRLSAAGNDSVWRELPELGGATRLVPKSGAVGVLAESAAGDPLLLASETGGGRVAALAVDETWKWHLHGYGPEHQRFWQQLVLWLARKENESDQPVWVRVEPRNFPPQSSVPIEFGAQDENGIPIPEASYQVEVIKPSGETEMVTPQRLDDGGIATFEKVADPGDYWVRVSATKDGQLLGSSAMTRFVVDSRDLELDNPSADPGLLAEISQMTGGTVVAQEEFNDFLSTLLEEGIPDDLHRYRRINLWDGWPLLLLFISLMSVEWSIRKWKGLV